MQCIALYRSGNWEALAQRDLAEKTADGNNVLHLICSQGDLQALKNLAERAQEKVENALAQVNNNGKTPLDLAKKEELVEYIRDELGVEPGEADSGITSLLARLGEVVREETAKISKKASGFQPLENNDFVLKLAKSLQNPSAPVQQGGSKEKSPEEYDMWRNPLYTPEKPTQQRAGAPRPREEEESDWNSILDDSETEMEGGKGCGSFPYDMTETSRQNVHRQLAADLISMSGGYVAYEEEDVIFGGAKKPAARPRSDERDEDPDFTPDEDYEDDEDDMLGGETTDDREYADLLLKRTLASNEFERLTRMPSSLEENLSRPRNEQADIAYKSFLPKLMEYLGLDEETAKFYRTAIKIHLLQSNPELRKNEDLKIKEMEKLFSSARTLKAAVKKIDFDEIKTFMESRREEGEKRRAERQDTKKKLRKERVEKKPETKAKIKAQPSRVRSRYVASENVYTDDE